MRPIASIVAVMAVVAGSPNGASAADFSSAYTGLDLDQCRMEAPPASAEEGVDGGIFWCVGYGDTPVRVTEGDLRYFVSYGTNAATEPAANQTLPGFNTIHTTLEWRLIRTAPGVASQPFVTILRYFEASGPTGTTETPILVVTRLGSVGEICHVGFVTVRGNPGANAMARALADRVAPTFRCGVDAVEIYGPDNRP